MPEKTLKIAKAIVEITALSLILTLSSLGIILAEDYPSGYLGSGYREYLGGKVQNGYYVETFANIDMRQQERVDKRNEIEKIVDTSYKAGPQSANGILAAEFQKKYNTDTLKQEINQQNLHREQVASVELPGGFAYIPHSDGQIDYFKDGLLIRTENERVVDQFGNLSLKNTFNIQYDDRRLMISYEATVTDNLGNVTRQHWYGATYSGDSLYYGNNETVANRNITEYYLEEIDSAGNVKLTHWQALSYEGKLVRAFHERIEDSVYGIADFTRTNIQYYCDNPNYVTSYHEEGIGTDGLAYTLDRTGVGYNEAGQLVGYHEVLYTTQIDGTVTKTTTDATFIYIDVPKQFGSDTDADPDRLLQSLITTVTENADGSTRTETTVTDYTYDAGLTLINAVGHSDYSGQEARWYEYTDAQGHSLIRSEDADGNVTYSYVDPDTLETVYVAADQVTATLKDGNKFQGHTDTQYEIFFGMPMAKETHAVTSYYGHSISDSELLRIDDSTITYTNGLVNNLRRVLTGSEHTVTTYPGTDPDNTHTSFRDVNTTYIYADNGNLIDLVGTGTGSGWEYSSTRGWYGQYTSIITEEYSVILGKPVRTDYFEDKDYMND